MINVFLLDRYRETLDYYLQTWARALQSKVRSISYESLLPGGTLAGNTFIFGDLERLKDEQCARADALAAEIISAGGRVLNRPGQVLRRHALLRSLHASGANPFNVYRESELSSSVRYPVFVRRERAHTGSLTPLLKNELELRRAIAHLKDTRRDTQDLLTVEFVDTASSADKLFRKYSLMRVGDQLIPRHVLFSTDWVDKHPDVVSEVSLREENDFLQGFAQAEEVRKIFDIARIEYGRIDYSFFDGKIVTWEINTNPTVLPLPEQCDNRRLAGQAVSAKLINRALLELANDKPITVQIKRNQRVILRTDLSRASQVVMMAAHLLATLQRWRIGRPWVDVTTRVVRLAKDQDSSPKTR